MALPAGSVLKLDIEKRVMANSCRVFDNASSEYLSQEGGADVDLDPTADWYVAFWIYFPTGYGTNDTTVSFVDDWNGTPATAWRCRIPNASTKMDTSYQNDGLGAHTVDVVPTIVDDTWYFCEVWWDASATTLYGTSNRATPDTENTGGTNSKWYSNTAFYLGTSVAGGGHADMRISTLVVVHGSIPTDAQKDDLYNGGVGRGAEYVITGGGWGATASYCWPLQETGGAAVEATGNGSAMSDNNTVLDAEGVTHETCLDLDGATTEYFSLTGGALDFADDTDWCVAIVQGSDAATEGNLLYVRDGNTGYIMRSSGDGNIYAYECMAGNGSGLTVLDAYPTNAGDQRASGEPQLLVFENDHSASLLRVWIDDLGSGDITNHSASFSNYDENHGNFYVGASNVPSSPHYGKIWYILGINGDLLTAAERAWLTVTAKSTYRSISDIQQAANNSNSPGTGIWAKCTWVLVPTPDGRLVDLKGSGVSFTANNTPTTATNTECPSRLLTDVSAAGVNYDGSDSCAVWRWEDLSGEDHHVLQNTFGDRPVYDNNSGDPIVTTTGTTHYLRAAFTTTYSSGGCVVARGAINNASYLYDGDDSSNRWALLEENGMSNWWVYAGVDLKYATSDTSEHTFFNTFNVASDTHRVDGSELSTGDSGTNSLDGFTVLCRFSNTFGAAGNYAKRYAVAAPVWTGTDITDAEEWVEYGDAGAPAVGGPKGVFGLALHGPMARAVYP